MFHNLLPSNGFGNFAAPKIDHLNRAVERVDAAYERLAREHPNNFLGCIAYLCGNLTALAGEPPVYSPGAISTMGKAELKGGHRKFYLPSRCNLPARQVTLIYGVWETRMDFVRQSRRPLPR